MVLTGGHAPLWWRRIKTELFSLTSPHLRNVLHLRHSLALHQVDYIFEAFTVLRGPSSRPHISRTIMGLGTFGEEGCEGTTKARTDLINGPTQTSFRIVLTVMGGRDTRMYIA